MKPLFSVIIPVRKINPYLRETLNKLKNQSLKNFEVLVITDKISGSANPAEKRNLAAKKAKGDYLVFFDDDSYPQKNYFKNAQKIIKANPKINHFCGPCLTPPKDNIFQKASGLVWSSWLGSGGAGHYRNHISPKRFVDDYPSVNLIIKKADFNQVGGFVTSYWPGEDTLLCLSIVKQLRQKILYHPRLIVYHHRRQVILPHLQQITRYAIHRGFFARKFPQTSFKIGYFLPSFFVFYLLSLIINYLTVNYNLLYFPLYLYLSILLITFVQYILDQQPLLLSILAVVSIPITHIYYGILFINGFFKKDVKFQPHTFDQKTGKYIGG